MSRKPPSSSGGARGKPPKAANKEKIRRRTEGGVGRNFDVYKGNKQGKGFVYNLTELDLQMSGSFEEMEEKIKQEMSRQESYRKDRSYLTEKVVPKPKKLKMKEMLSLKNEPVPDRNLLAELGLEESQNSLVKPPLPFNCDISNVE